MQKEEFLQWAHRHLSTNFLQRYGEQLERHVEKMPKVDDPWSVVDKVQMGSFNGKSFDQTLNSPLNST